MQEASKAKSLIAKKEKKLKESAQAELKPIKIEKNVGKKFVIEIPVNLSTGYAWYWLVNDPLRKRPVELYQERIHCEKYWFFWWR